MLGSARAPKSDPEPMEEPEPEPLLGSAWAPEPEPEPLEEPDLMERAKQMSQLLQMQSWKEAQALQLWQPQPGPPCRADSARA